MPWPDRRRPGPLAGLLVIAGLVLACAPNDTAVTPTPGPTAAPTSAASAPTSAASAAPSAATVAPAGPSVGPSAGLAGAASPAPLVVDSGLLAVLPDSVAGVPMQPSPETAAGMLADGALAGSASALAVGLVIAPGDSGDDDLAISTVLRLRPGVYDDAFYAEWRASYDESACAPAGGVASSEQHRIGGRIVEVTICNGGARTYHAQLDGDLLVSVTSAGQRDFGALVMAGLRG